jgi:hypothetical protein
MEGHKTLLKRPDAGHLDITSCCFQSLSRKQKPRKMKLINIELSRLESAEPKQDFAVALQPNTDNLI